MTTKIKTPVTLKEQITKLALKQDKKTNKPSAQHAFDTLMTSIEKNGSILDGETRYSDSKTELLAIIYSHLLPSRPRMLAEKDRSDDFKWVNQVVSKDASRHALQNVHVDEDFMVGTDGKRLHLVPNTDGKFELGFYDKSETKIDPDYSYPTYRQVLPDYNEHYTATVVTDKSELFELKEHCGIYTYEIPVGDYTIILYAEYVDQALCGAEEFTLYSIEEFKSVVIAYGDRVALMMPLRNSHSF